VFHVEQGTAVSFEWVAQLSAEAYKHRAEFHSHDNRIEAADQDTAAVNVWSDPEIAAGPVFYDSDRLAPSTFGDIGYSIRQRLPKPKEKELLGRAASLHSDFAALDRAISEANLRRDLYKALIREAQFFSTIELRLEDLRWIKTMVTRKEDRFKVQQQGHAELMALQNERALKELELQLLTNRVRAVQFEVRRLLGRDLTATGPVPRLPIPINPIPYQPRLVERAHLSNPELRLLQKSIEMAESDQRITELELLPRWTLELQARQYSGDGGFREGSAWIGFTFPWANRRSQRAAISAGEHRIQSASALLEEDQARLSEKLHRQTLEMDGIDRALRIHRDEIHLRRQEVAASAQSAWEVNRGSLDDLLQARRYLLADRLKVVELTAALHLLAADIVRLAGALNPLELVD